MQIAGFPGRSPDLRFIGSGLPSRFLRNSGLLDQPSALTVAGPCWILTSFPKCYRGFARNNNETIAARGARVKARHRDRSFPAGSDAPGPHPVLEKRELAVVASLLADEVGLRLETAIAADVLDIDAALQKHAADQQSPVTAGRIFFAA